MIVLILLSEQMLKLSGHGELWKVMEKVMESHGIVNFAESMNPAKCLIQG